MYQILAFSVCALYSVIVLYRGWQDVCVHPLLTTAVCFTTGKAQLFINSYAKALEVIPRQLCDNSGFDATDVLNKLRQKHALADGSGQVGVATRSLQFFCKRGLAWVQGNCRGCADA
jgi:hypothetical protein